MGFPAAIYHQNVVLDRSVLSDLMADLLWIEPRLARGVHLCTELDNNQVRAFFFEKKEFSANNQVRVHLRSSLD